MLLILFMNGYLLGGRDGVLMGQNIDSQKHQQGEKRVISDLEAGKDSLTIAPQMLQHIFDIFEPQRSELPKERLSIDQLHEWVGEPMLLPDDTTQAEVFNEAYFRLHCYNKNLKKCAEKIIEERERTKNLYKGIPTRRKAKLESLDFNAGLSRCFSREYRQMLKNRRQVQENRAKMDYLYPIFYQGDELSGGSGAKCRPDSLSLHPDKNTN